MNKKEKYYFSLPCSSGAFLTNEFVFSKNKILDLIRKEKQLNNYEEISTPIFFSHDTFKKTGHINYFSKNMFSFENLYLKPMSCPGAAFYIKKQIINNKDVFPKKIFEFGNVFRKEDSGAVRPLTRCLNFTQDDSHIFAKNETQIKIEIEKLLIKYIRFYKLLSWDVKIHLSLPEKNNSLFNEEQNKKITELMTNLLQHFSKKYEFDFVISENEGAFYGPKIDFLLDDKIQLSTIQIDFFLCKNLDVKFYDNETKFFPIVIHTAMLGSIERFMYFLLEKNNNIFPFWCSKKPFIICKINYKNDKNNSVVSEIEKFFSEKKIHYEFSQFSSLQETIKNYSTSVLLFIGEKEEKNRTISLKNLSILKKENIDIDDFFYYIDIRIKIFDSIFNEQTTL